MKIHFLLLISQKHSFLTVPPLHSESDMTISESALYCATQCSGSQDMLNIYAQMLRKLSDAESLVLFFRQDRNIKTVVHSGTAQTV